MTANDWLANDSLFRAEVAAGHRWERAIAARFDAAGVPVYLPPQRVRADVSEALRGDFRASVDLWVDGLPVQIKSRKVARFYDPQYITGARQWASVGATTFLWVVVSQITAEAICVSGARARRLSTETVTRCRTRGLEGLRVRQLALRYWSPLDAAIGWFVARGKG